MPIPEDMAKVQLVFDLCDGDTAVDVAVTGFHLHARITTGQTTHWADWCQATAEGIRDRWVEHVTAGYFSHAVRASVCKVYHLDTSNHTLDEGQAAFTGTSAWRGNATTSLPWETSVVVSTYGWPAGTFTPQRASKRGRMYLPPIGPNHLGGDQGKLDAQDQVALAGYMKAFFDDVQGMHLDNESGPTDLHWDLAILSTTHNMWTQMERFDIGNVLDVQRRRRNKQQENRVGDVIVVGPH